jgi:hypothetical protein
MPFTPELFSARVLERLEELAPQAGVAVYVRGPHGKLAATRIYDDTDPPLGYWS